MSSNKKEEKKQFILRAAEKLFAQKGFQDTTIVDIVRESKISEATFYEYFPSKEELLFSIPGELTRNEKVQIEFILEHVRGAANKIRSYIYDYLWFWQTHSDYAAVAFLILKPNRKFINTEAYNLINDTMRILLPVIEEGIAKGEFRAGTDPRLTLTMILSTTEYLVVNRVLNGTPENLLEDVDPITDQLLGGILNV